MSVIDSNLKENLNVTFTRQESPKRNKNLSDNSGGDFIHIHIFIHIF